MRTSRAWVALGSLALHAAACASGDGGGDGDGGGGAEDAAGDRAADEGTPEDAVPDEPGHEEASPEDGPADGECPPGETRCETGCADLSSDPGRCGACDAVCDPPNASGECAGGGCRVGACDTGFVDANRDPSDGCELECTPSGEEGVSAGNCADGADNDCDARTDATDPGCASCVPELCNGADDDCDGLTDENFDPDFDPVNCGRCGLACAGRPHAGPACTLGECTVACEPGWSDVNGLLEDGCEAVCTPVEMGEEERCDGVDSDCDGLTDEEWSAAMWCGEGLCRRSAICFRGDVICRPRAAPASVDQTCDALDDDCDGSTDEEFVPSTCVGACVRDALCAAGRVICGTPAAGDGTCDALDDDCDGATDEDYEPYSCGVGECARESTCVRGTADCIEGPPAAEACNLADDDCDGATDEDFDCRAGETGPCTTSCGSAGTWACEPTCAWGSCAPPPEVCNAADDDCDGTTDEGFACVQGSSESCTASCGTTGSRDCSGSCDWGACNPPAEVCNAADDDCDGTTDEGFACVRGSSGSCTTSCGTTGSHDCSGSCDWGVCNPPAEVCNGADDNCDGTTDEGCCLIDVLSAIYAANCGAPTPMSSVATSCNGLRTCTYTTNYSIDPGYDPAYGCPKDLTVRYRCLNCPGATDTRTIYVPGEAGTGSVITLRCP